MSDSLDDLEGMGPVELPEHPNRTSFFEPLEVYLPVGVLIRAVTDSAIALNQRRKEGSVTAEERATLGHLLAQRDEAMRWLHGVVEEQLLVAFYPVSKYDPEEPSRDELADGQSGYQ